MEKNQKEIAFFGTGLLGEPMAHQLVDSGYDVIVYNRTGAKTRNLVNKGAAATTSPLDAVKIADVSITMLSDFAAIESVLFPSDASLPLLKNKTLIQMGTISPTESLLLKQRLESVGGTYLEAPVLGSIPQAKSRSLFVLVGGAETDFRRLKPLFLCFGAEEQILFFGETGKAAAVKLALNQLIASLTAAFSMSLGFLREYDADIEKFMSILRDSALYAPTFDKKFSKMMSRNFENPNFPIKHLLKDVNLMLAAFNDKQIDIAPLQGVRKVLQKSLQIGDSDLDYSALYNAIHPVN
jgi:3-hydroxyisobutyrate dehydrogenase